MYINVDSDQILCSAACDLGLHYLQLLLYFETTFLMHKCVIIMHFRTKASSFPLLCCECHEGYQDIFFLHNNVSFETHHWDAPREYLHFNLEITNTMYNVVKMEHNLDAVCKTTSD